MTEDGTADEVLAVASTGLTQLRTSTGALAAALAAATWSEAEVAAPTLLPGWTRGHLLTHLARNADGIARTLSGALEQQVLARYPDGMAARDADIAAGAGRSAIELIADVTDSAERLDRVLAAVADARAWTATTDDHQPAWHWLEARQREVEFHRVDLADGYGAEQWPAALIARELPRVVESLADRADEAVHIRLDDDSTAVDLVGAEWRVGAGSGDAVRVHGPDWAVLAWLIGRPEATQGRLSTTPPLRPWR